MNRKNIESAVSYKSGKYWSPARSKVKVKHFSENSLRKKEGKTRPKKIRLYCLPHACFDVKDNKSKLLSRKCKRLSSSHTSFGISEKEIDSSERTLEQVDKMNQLDW